MNRFVTVDPKLCIGCKTCEIACVLAHIGEQVGAIDPEEFHPRIKVIKGDDISGAVMCRQCEDAPCVNACPNGAIVRGKDSIDVLQEKCIGCKTCVLVCPYGAMTVNMRKVPRYVGDQQMGFTYKAEAHKCDLCQGRSKGPACVETCPTNALRIMGPQDMLKIQQDRQKAALAAMVF